MVSVNQPWIDAVGNDGVLLKQRQGYLNKYRWSNSSLWAYYY
jgi:hypothetical protein